MSPEISFHLVTHTIHVLVHFRTIQRQASQVEKKRVEEGGVPQIMKVGLGKTLKALSV